VLAITFGATRIILGGDLPWTETGKRPPPGELATKGVIASGWETVKRTYALDHHALKVPHHASADALHPDLLATSQRPRIWTVTPKNGSRLPTFGNPGAGVDILLEIEERFLLSVTPSSWWVPDPLPATGVVQRNGLRRRTDVDPTADVFANASDDTRSRPVDPRETVWALAFDDAGNMVSKERGSAAIELVR